MPAPLLVTFAAGLTGPWRVERVAAVRGEGLPGTDHIHTGLKYLPAVARQLYHCRDLGEPFDFLTWFEYAPADAAAFEELVARLRETEEWFYVEREVDLRLVRAD